MGTVVRLSDRYCARQKQRTTAQLRAEQKRVADALYERRLNDILVNEVAAVLFCCFPPARLERPLLAQAGITGEQADSVRESF